jgi:hypothetical protein
MAISDDVAVDIQTAKCKTIRKISLCDRKYGRKDTWYATA